MLESGREVCDKMQTIKPDVRVLFCSGYSSDGLHAGFIDDKGLQIIHKPHTPNELLQKVREVLDLVVQV